MSSFVKFILPGDREIAVEVTETSKGIPTSGGVPFSEAKMGLGTKMRDAAKHSLVESLKAFSPAIEAIVDELRRSDPDSLKLEMKVALTTELGIAVAKANGTGNFHVTMTWDKKVNREK